jgi:hypothetical protein
MNWLPIPDDGWVPPEHERDKFFNVYIDETSQTEYRYLIIGGLVVPLSHTAQLEADIIAARADTVVPSMQPDGTPRVMKWQKLNAYNFDVYKRVVDTVFNFRRTYKLPLSKDVAVHCVGVDTSVKSLKDIGAGDMGVGFDKEFHFLCCVILLRRYRQALFMLFPDRREPTTQPRKARDIMNLAAAKYGDTREFPFRRLIFADPECCQALQAVDIIIGGIAYKLTVTMTSRAQTSQSESSVTTYTNSSKSQTCSISRSYTKLISSRLTCARNPYTEGGSFHRSLQIEREPFERA